MAEEINKQEENTIIKSRINQFEEHLKSIKEEINIRGKEIDNLQIDIKTPKKWWKASSNIFSLIAIIISITSIFYSVYKDRRNEISEQQLRVKQIVERLSEISKSRKTYGIKFGFDEESNLVDEALNIFKEDYKNLNDSEYATVINSLLNTNKLEDFEELMSSALKVVDDAPTEYTILNQKAQYVFTVKKDSIEGRKIMLDIINKTENQLLSSEYKDINIAQEYGFWSDYELNLEKYIIADSLLFIAEKSIFRSEDSWKFENHEITHFLSSRRRSLNNILTRRGIKTESMAPPSLTPPSF